MSSRTLGMSSPPPPRCYRTLPCSRCGRLSLKGRPAAWAQGSEELSPLLRLVLRGAAWVCVVGSLGSPDVRLGEMLLLGVNLAGPARWGQWEIQKPGSGLKHGVY